MRKVIALSLVLSAAALTSAAVLRTNKSTKDCKYSFLSKFFCGFYCKIFARSDPLSCTCTQRRCVTAESSNGATKDPATTETIVPEVVTDEHPETPPPKEDKILTVDSTVMVPEITVTEDESKTEATTQTTVAVEVTTEAVTTTIEKQPSTAEADNSASTAEVSEESKPTITSSATTENTSASETTANVNEVTSNAATTETGTSADTTATSAENHTTI